MSIAFFGPRTKAKVKEGPKVLYVDGVGGVDFPFVERPFPSERQQNTTMFDGVQERDVEWLCRSIDCGCGCGFGCSCRSSIIAIAGNLYFYLSSSSSSSSSSSNVSLSLSLATLSSLKFWSPRRTTLKTGMNRTRKHEHIEQVRMGRIRKR